jgi:hypothetical protein
VFCLLALPSPPLPRMSGHLFCPHQKQQTYFYSHTASPVPPPCPSPLSAFPSLCLLDPGLPWKTCTMVAHDFLKLLPHLVCHAPWSTPTLNQLLGAGRDKGAHRKLWLHHTPALTPLPQGEEGKQTGMHVHRDTGLSPRLLGHSGYTSKATSHTWQQM